MKRAFAGLVLVLCGVGYASAAVTYDYVLDADGVPTTPASWAIVDNFTTQPSGWTLTGGAVVTGSLAGHYSAPFDSAAMAAPDATPYVTVPIVAAQSGSATINFGGAPYTYLGLFWGSVDAFNKVEFLNNGNVVAQYTGADLTAPTDSAYVNFSDMPLFDSVRFSSSAPSFEFDNVAVSSTVPVPGAMALGSLGMALIGWLRSRKQM